MISNRGKLSILSLLVFSICFTLLIPFSSTNAQSESKVFEIDDENYTQVIDSKEAKGYLAQVKAEQKENAKQLKEDGITLENPAVFKQLSSGLIIVVYELHSKKVELDELSTISFIISNDSDQVVSQYLKVINIDNDQQQVTLSQNNKVYADFIVTNDSEYVSGWVLTPDQGKIDVASKEYQEYLMNAEEIINANEPPKFETAGFNSCMDNCFDDSKIPKWIQDTINTVAAVSCVFGPNPVCLLAITQVAAPYGSKAITCAIDCL